MYRKILVPLDGSELSEHVLPYVTEIAKGCRTEEVVLFRVCEPPSILADYPASLQTSWEDHVRQETAHIQQQCRLYLDDAEKKLAGQGFKVTTKASLGNPAEEILNYAMQEGVDLIIIASHGHSGFTRWAFGNTTNKIFQSSTIPVLIIKPAKERNPRH